MIETQTNIYERFLSGMMSKDKDKRHEEKVEQSDEDGEDIPGQLGTDHVLVSLSGYSCCLLLEILTCLSCSFQLLCILIAHCIISVL